MREYDAVFASGGHIVPTDRPIRLFLSYPHKDSEICEDIYHALVQRGHSV